MDDSFACAHFCDFGGFPVQKARPSLFSIAADVPIDDGFLSPDDGSPVTVDTISLLPCLVSDSTAALIWAMESFLPSINNIVLRNWETVALCLLVTSWSVYLSFMLY